MNKDDIAPNFDQNLTDSININDQIQQESTSSQEPVNEPEETVPVETFDIIPPTGETEAVPQETEIPAEQPAEVSSVQEVAPVEAETPVATTEETPVAEQAPVPEMTNEEKAAAEAAKNEAKREARQKAAQIQAELKAARQKHFDDIFDELKAIKESNQPLVVQIKSRIKGGLRVVYKEVPLFLPASHYSLRRTPTEEELQEAVGKSVDVIIHEIQEFDENRKTVIVSRKQLLMNEIWSKINVGDIIEGKVSSVATFGVFVDIGGVEGLIHISRLSQVHVDDPRKFYKRGDIIKAVIVEIDHENNRIALSRKELEESPWKNANEEFQVGTEHTGIVRRMTDFGAYVELKPGIDGLLRISEVSWTKRIRKPSDVFKIGQEIPVHILSVSEEHKTISLSYKMTQPNPWGTLIERFPLNTQFEGTIVTVNNQGAVVSISEDVDGFMPRSKMKRLLMVVKNQLKPGDKLTVEVTDLIPEEESLILAPIVEEEAIEHRDPPKPKKQQSSGNPGGDPSKDKGQSSFTLLDLISDNEKDSLINSLPE